jgi:hypothetical protein
MPASQKWLKMKRSQLTSLMKILTRQFDLIPVIFSLFGNEDIDTTQFGLTNKSDFYLGTVMVSALDLIADKYMQRYAKPIPDTEKITALSIILRF